MGEHSCALCAGRCAAAVCMLTPSPTGGTRGGELSIRVAAPRTRAAFNYTFSVFCRATALSTWVDGQQIIYYSCALTRLHFYVLDIRVPHLKALHFCECCLCLATKVISYYNRPLACLEYIPKIYQSCAKSFQDGLRKKLGCFKTKEALSLLQMFW